MSDNILQLKDGAVISLGGKKGEITTVRLNKPRGKKGNCVVDISKIFNDINDRLPAEEEISDTVKDKAEEKKEEIESLTDEEKTIEQINYIAMVLSLAEDSEKLFDSIAKATTRFVDALEDESGDWRKIASGDAADEFTTGDMLRIGAAFFIYFPTQG